MEAQNEIQKINPEIRRDQVRKLLRDLLRTDTDFEEFCIDYFPDVEAKFSNGMERVAKENLLIKRVELNAILRALFQFFSEDPTSLGAIQVVTSVSSSKEISNFSYKHSNIATHSLMEFLPKELTSRINTASSGSREMRSRLLFRSGFAIGLTSLVVIVGSAAWYQHKQNRQAEVASQPDLISPGRVDPLVISSPIEGKVNPAPPAATTTTDASLEQPKGGNQKLAEGHVTDDTEQPASKPKKVRRVQSANKQAEVNKKLAAQVSELEIRKKDVQRFRNLKDIWNSYDAWFTKKTANDPTYVTSLKNCNRMINEYYEKFAPERSSRLVCASFYRNIIKPIREQPERPLHRNSDDYSDEISLIDKQIAELKTNLTTSVKNQ